MTTVLAAIDRSAAARPVVETAVRMGVLAGARVEAVHVAPPSDGAAAADAVADIAERAGVALHVLEGPVDQVLLEALDAPDVVAGVVGARATPGGARPVGHVTRALVERSGTPIVVVPPDLVAHDGLHRLLVPLEGTEESSRPVLDHLWPLLDDDVDIVVLHVFTETTLPAMLDHPVYDLEVLGSEFLSRHFPAAGDIELRPGPVGRRIAEVSVERQADLVVLAWSQNASPDRAAVVREVLSASALPVLLLPVSAADAGAPGEDPAPSSPSGALSENAP